MVRAFFLVFVLAAALVGFPGGAGAQAVAGAAVENKDLIDRLVRSVNRERALNGARPVVLERRLTLAAQRHSDDMAQRNYFAHQSPDGRGMSERVIAAGYPWRVMAENLSAGVATPESTVAAWMTSPQHRQNMLGDEYIHIGVGYTVGGAGEIKPDYAHYWTIVLGAPSR